MIQKWFKEAKLGIFLHYGIYAVDGTSESWCLYFGGCTKESYYDQANRFIADGLDTSKWAKQIKDAGARYAVMTTKHHDGFAMWPTKQSKLNVFDAAPAKKDIVKMFVEGMKKESIKAGLYFSILDWSHPDYPTQTHPYPERFPKTWGLHLRGNLNFCEEGKEDDKRWANFLDFNNKQLTELSSYKPDLFWFDGDWTRTPAQWKSKEMYDYLQKLNPEVVMNSRFNRERGYGDYDNPEQDIPISKPPRDWEFCVTMNNSWGYQPHDKAWKTPEQIIKLFIDIISLGGNMLLNVGPKQNGDFPEEAQNILKHMGEVTKKYGEGIYGTIAGLPHINSRTHSTMSQDKRKLSFFMFGSDNWIHVKGIQTKAIKAYDLETKKEVKFEWTFSHDHGYAFMWINLESVKGTDYVRAIQVEFEDEIKYVTESHINY